MNKSIIVTIISLIIGQSLWAQEPKDTLNTEVINVVKPYKPSISDAFKVKDIPNTNDVDEQKQSIDYQINSVPVASTFTPSKGKAKGVKKKKKERLYDNYISVGFGNYTTPLLEAYVRTFPVDDGEFGVMLKHHSSQGGIKDVLLNDSFYDSNLDLYFLQSSRAMNWKVNLGAQHQLYNWYGLIKPDNYDETSPFNPTLLESVDPKQSYLNFALDGKIEYFNSYFTGGTASVRRFSDAYKSSEIRFRTQPKFELPISTEIIDFELDIDYLNGAFEKQYQTDDAISYNYLNLGLTPNFQILRDYLRINLGVKAYYALDLESSTGSFKLYPNVDISYQLLTEVLTIFAGATGGLHHNTYLDMVQQNPFLSPNLMSVPTDEKYRAFAGLKGKLASNINYLVKGSYADLRNMSFQIQNPTKTDGSALNDAKAYELGNSFGVVYDDVKNLSLYGEVAIDFSKEFTFGSSVNYDSYSMASQLEPWNLPNFKATFFTDYHADKWTGEAKLFMMGARKDIILPLVVPAIYPFPYEDYIVTNNTYLDLNAGISYAFSNRLSAFAKGHNLLTTHYKRFYNYPVQGIQVLGGITYKFDL